MKVKFPYALVLTLLLSVYIATPADIVGAPQASSSRAGEVTRVIPEVNIARGLKTVTASAKSVWTGRTWSKPKSMAARESHWTMARY